MQEPVMPRKRTERWLKRYSSERGWPPSQPTAAPIHGRSKKDLSSAVAGSSGSGGRSIHSIGRPDEVAVGLLDGFGFSCCWCAFGAAAAAAAAAAVVDLRSSGSSTNESASVAFWFRNETRNGTSGEHLVLQRDTKRHECEPRRSVEASTKTERRKSRHRPSHMSDAALTMAGRVAPSSTAMSSDSGAWPRTICWC